MPAPYAAESIANLFIRKSISDKNPIDPMKLQKLIYLAHGYYMALTRRRQGKSVPLVNEFFEAWQYGPVLPSIYHEFKSFGSDTITSPAMLFDRSFGVTVVASPPNADAIFDKVSDFVWDRYAKKHSTALSDLTHKADGAWDKARKAAHGLKGKDIPNEDIADDFLAYVT